MAGAFLSQLAPGASLSFPAKLFGFESRTCNILKQTKQFSEMGGQWFHNVKSNIVVHAQLGQTMPVCHYKQ
jgi:hypothetical protein